jgi:hypothetical protein
MCILAFAMLTPPNYVYALIIILISRLILTYGI